MNLHFEEIGRQVAPDAHAVILLDRAGWHITAKLNVPDNITLLPLPPVSPNSIPSKTSGSASASPISPTEPSRTMRRS